MSLESGVEPRVAGLAHDTLPSFSHVAARRRELRRPLMTNTVLH